MKDFCNTVLIKLLQIVMFVITAIWLSIWFSLAIPGLFISMLIATDKKYEDITDKFLNLLVLPYKWIGVCTDWKSFTVWMQGS